MAEPYRIVVTEVTLYGRLRCVAGWDMDRKRMIRPEPAPGAFWDARFCGERTTFHPGHVVEFRADQPDTPYPHRTEDRVVLGEPRCRQRLAWPRFLTILEEAEDADLTGMFDGALIIEGHHAFVPEGRQCRSLGGLRVALGNLEVRDVGDAQEPKLRAHLTLLRRDLRLSVAAKDLRQLHVRDGVAAVRARLADAESLHVRLGLARLWTPDHGTAGCYLQINGVYPL